MSVTVGTIFELAMSIMDQRLEDGRLSERDVSSYRSRTPHILTVLQGELLWRGGITKTFECEAERPQNLLEGCPDSLRFCGEPISLCAERGKTAYAYYFEADGDGIAAVEQLKGSEWRQLALITLSGSRRGFTAYKGAIDPDKDAFQIRLRFWGERCFRIRRCALYPVRYAEECIPDNVPFLRVEMPRDFWRVESVRAFDRCGARVRAGLRWERDGVLAIDRREPTRLTVRYIAAPSVLASMEDRVEVDDLTAVIALPNGLAACLLADENPELAAFFRQRYADMKEQCGMRPPAAEELIEDAYGG